MKRLWISGLLVAGVTLGIYALGGAPAQDDGKRSPPARDAHAPPAQSSANPAPGPGAPSAAEGDLFEGKLVALSLRGSTQKLLEEARLEQIHGRSFVVGNEIQATFSFPLGSKAHVAWDAVESFYLFDSVEQYESAVRSTLGAVQGSVPGLIGEFFPGAKVSGVNVNVGSPYCPQGLMPQPTFVPVESPDPVEFPGDETPGPAPDDQSASPTVSEYVTADGRRGHPPHRRHSRSRRPRAPGHYRSFRS